VLLLGGMIPSAFAEEIPSDNISESESTPEQTLSDDSEDEYGVMALASTQSSIMLFDYADNGNYTTVLNSQVTCTYKPNGTDTTRTAYIKNLGWHFARYGGVAYADDPLYCIEPWRSYAASTSGNSVDREVTLDGSGSTTGSNVWYALPTARREAIGLILLYSNQMWDHSISVTTTKKDANPNVPLRIATQFLIFEIVCGLRDPSSFTVNSTNESGTAGDIFYNAGVASVTNFASNYNTLVSYVQSAKKIPSFTSASSSSAPTITLNGTTATATDSNGVLSNFSFSNGNGASFSKSGNTLTVTQTGTISESTVYSATRTVPSASNSTYCLWYMSGSSYQTTISLCSASTGSLRAYFKLKAVPQVGSISLTKTTEDGKNLSGWQFGIYSNSACTNLVSGPHTTNANGKISVTDLSAGTYYVKELGHTDSAINALYYCSSTNPQAVTVTAGGTTSVSFNNKLNTGSISLTKTTEDGQSLSGWQFGIYSNSACTTLVSGPHSTNTSGKISVTGLAPGTYYVKEIGHTDSAINALYYCSSTNPQAVTVTAGGTAAVSFTNKLNTGSVKLVKSTNTGANLSGWQIGLYTDSACTSAVSGSPFTTGADGTVVASAMLPGTYYAKEISTDDPYWEFDTAVKSVTVAVGQTAEVTFSNTHYGRIEIRKTTNTGNQLGGWTFRVRDSEGNSYGDFTTDDNGYACTQNLPLGRYTVVELPTEDNYWLTELGFHDVTVKAGETTMDTWLNKEQGLAWFYKKTNTGESVEGWHITVYSDEACTQKVGTLITNADGKAGYYLDPGTYWAKETGDEHGRFEDEYWMVDETVQKFEIKPHEDVSITFTNVQYGRLKITKTVEGGGSVEGWQFKITDAEGKVLDGSPFASDKDGIILTGNLLPGKYTVEELLPENSLYQCVSKNPQTVTVKQGEIAEVAFVNALRFGKISIEKIDTAGEHLAGATFLLEWSAEGSLWYPVKYSGELIRGGCSNSALEDGKLTSGEDGMMIWDNLYPGLYYRVTELKAPNGYELLKGYAFEGELPADDLQVSLQVVNAKGFSLPDTGVSTGLILRIMQLLCAAVCAALLLISYKKKRW
ncbi:MAG: SpaA isopeptide-forming pilin-related protein, partial [Faecousia sp.]